MHIALKYLKIILNRSIIFYLLCSFLIWHWLDYHALVNNAIPQTMSRLTPPIDYFDDFISKQNNYDRFKLMDCIYYHKAVAKYFPFQKAESLGMMGFCYERLGQKQLAIDAYKQSIASNPDYFWPYYDLGVIFYNQNQYSKAAEYFQNAAEEDPVKTIVLLSRSKVYNDVRLSDGTGSYNVIQSIKEGQKQAMILMMESLNKLGLYDQLLAVAINGIKQGTDDEGIFYYYAAVAAYYQKYYPQSLRFLQISLQANANNPDAYLYMGMGLKMVGQEGPAQLFIQRASLMNKQGISTLKKYLNPQVRFF